MQLVVCVLNKTSALESILKEFGKNGIKGATVLDFAFIANLFNGRFYFHVTIPFLSLFMHKAYFALQVMRPLEIS